MEKEKYSIIKLSLAKNIGPIRFFNLLSHFKSAENVLNASKSDLTAVEGISDLLAANIISQSNSNYADKEIALAAKKNIQILTFIDDTYPKSLNYIADKPPILYVKGNLLPSDIVSLSIVGSRKASNYGKVAAGSFASYFSQKNITVISGLARGIDTEAHTAALKNNGRTIAVLGNGLLTYYPPENNKIQDKIADTGAVISEFPLNTPSDRQNFPKRNRIIAALSLATLIVEADIASGAMITAKICAEYGKDVFALPGNIYSRYSKGPNFLIKNGSFVALSPEDMLTQIDALAHLTNSNCQPELITTPSLTNEEKQIFEVLSDNLEGLHPDIISFKTNMPISKVSTILVNLEIIGIVKSMPGQIYTILK